MLSQLLIVYLRGTYNVGIENAVGVVEFELHNT